MFGSRRWHIAYAAALALVLSTAQSSSASNSVSSAAPLPLATRATAASPTVAGPVANPAGNAVPKPDYYASCWNGGAKGASATVTCHSQTLAAINHQHVLEHVPQITLPRTYWTLAPALQIFVITNLERVSRGLEPALGTTAPLNDWALAGARRNVDPALAAWTLSGGTTLQSFGSIWASDLGPLDADFLWMYADGWASGGTTNVDCTSARSAGCWGHRQVVLGGYGGSTALVAGTASLTHYNSGGLLNSDTQIFASYTARRPVLAYTWAQAVAAGAH